MPPAARPGRPALALAWLLLAALLFEPVLELWPDVRVADRGRLPLGLASASFLALAVATWRAGRRPLVARLNVAVVSACLLGPPAAELALRASFRVPGSPTRAPIRYAHNLIHDDHWLLAGRWAGPEERIAPRRVHPTLGWSQGPVTNDEPLGLGKRSRAQLVRDGRPKVLFYGDSYVAGHSAPENWLPRYLDARVDGADVVHLGVGGYGTGQAYLLYEATHDMVERPFVIMSAMVFDLDRSTLRVRSYQKPRLRVGAGGALEVTNTPVDPDPDRYFRETPLELSSFLLAALRTRWFELHDPAFAEKLELNRAILAATRGLAEEDGSELLFVLFHPLPELLEEDVRSTFFLETLADLGIDTFDTRGPLLRYVAETGIDPAELYVTGHHNDLGNRVVGDALLEALRQRGVR